MSLIGLTTTTTTIAQTRMGCLYKLLMHNPSGHYLLDLSVAKERDAMLRLAELNTEDREYLRIRFNNIDTSQHQNFHRFRNELKNEEPRQITSKTFEDVRGAGQATERWCV